MIRSTLSHRVTASMVILMAVVSPVHLYAQSTAKPAPVVSTLRTNASVSGTIVANGEHVYIVALNRNQYLDVALDSVAQGKPIALRVFAPDSTWVGSIFSWQREAGRPEFNLLAESKGNYRLQITGADTARYRLQLRSPGNSDAATEAMSLEAATAWLVRNTHKLSHVEAGRGFEDLAPLRSILAGVRVVGLGEATHGSREFEQVKHRFLEFLVREMGYTVFGLESSSDAARSINEFVLSGRGDRASVLAGQGFWNWDTEEVAATIDWMRDYNRSVPDARKVRFAGFDFQYNPQSRKEITEYLRRVAPTRVARTDSILAVLTEPVDTLRRDFVRYYSLKPEAKAPLVAAVNELRGFLELNRVQFSRQTSASDFEAIVHSVNLLQQLVDTHSRAGYAVDTAGTGVTTRDRYMAENILELLRVLPADTKIVLSAHNAHVRSDLNLYTMGHYLREELGNAYYAFGLSFERGSFRALNLAQTPYKVGALTVGPSFPQSIDWYLKRAGKGDLFVDFRAAPSSGPAASWLKRPHRMRSIGGGHPPNDPGYYGYPVVPGKSFDGLIFVQNTTPTRLNPTVTR